MNNTSWVNDMDGGNIAPGEDQVHTQPTPQVDSQHAQPQVYEPSSHSVNQDTIGVDGYMPNAHPDNLNEPSISNNVHNGQVPSSLWVQDAPDAQLQLTEDSARRALAPQLTEEATDGNTQPISSIHDGQAPDNPWVQDTRAAQLQLAEDNVRRAIAPQLTTEAIDGNPQPNMIDHMPIPGSEATYGPRQTFRDLWPAQVLEWPALAASIGRCQMPPVRLQTQVQDWQGERVVTYFLPDPHDLRTWHVEDVTTFVNRLHNEGVFVDWGNLGAYFNPGQARSAGWYENDTVLNSQDHQYPPGQESQPALGSELPPGAQSDKVISARDVLAHWQSLKGETFDHRRDENILTPGLASELHVLVGRFSSQQEREDYLSTHDNTWEPPRGDNTIPTSDEQMKAIVTDLVFAMSSTEFAADSEANNAWKARWLPGQLFYGREKIVLRCWQLAETARKLHQEGPSALQCFDSKFATVEFAKTKSWTFQERIDVMVNLLSTRKSRCDALMKGDQIDVFVGAPGKLLKTATANAPNNAKKGEAIKRGREAIKDDQVAGKSTSTSRPAPVPTRTLFGHQVAAPARTSDLNARETSERNADQAHLPQPGFRNRGHLGTAAYPSPAYTSDSSVTTPGGHAMTNPESFGPQDLWGQTGATSRTNSRGFIQQQDPYGIPRDTFPAQGRTRQPGPHQPTFPGLSSNLSHKRTAVDDLNASAQKRPSVQEDALISSSYGPRPPPQQVNRLHHGRQNTTSSLLAYAQSSYPSSGPVSNFPQSIQPQPQAQQLLQSQHEGRLPPTASSSTVQQVAPQTTAQLSPSLKRGSSGNLQPPTGRKRVREQ